MSRRSRKVGRPKDLDVYNKKRGCTRQTSKKYRSRTSPPYPANLCREMIKFGNDGKLYKSSRTHKKGKAYYRWVLKK